MSFNRASYDPCTYKHDVTQSVNIGTYQLETPRPHCDPCFVADPSVRIQRFGAASCAMPGLIDVDSELMGLTRRYTRCPEPHSMSSCELKTPTECSFLAREDTRLSNPPCTLRSTGWNRWEWLTDNPQLHAIPEFPMEIQYRLIVKDNHKPVVPNILDQSAVYPPNWKTEACGDNRVQWSCNEKPFPTTTWRSCDEIARL
jgi:hypothetical protein